MINVPPGQRMYEARATGPDSPERWREAKPVAGKAAGKVQTSFSLFGALLERAAGKGISFAETTAHPSDEPPDAGTEIELSRDPEVAPDFTAAVNVTLDGTAGPGGQQLPAEYEGQDLAGGVETAEGLQEGAGAAVTVDEAVLLPWWHDRHRADNDAHLLGRTAARAGLNEGTAKPEASFRRFIPRSAPWQRTDSFGMPVANTFVPTEAEAGAELSPTAVKDLLPVRERHGVLAGTSDGKGETADLRWIGEPRDDAAVPMREDLPLSRLAAAFAEADGSIGRQTSSAPVPIDSAVSSDDGHRSPEEGLLHRHRPQIESRLSVRSGLGEGPAAAERPVDASVQTRPLSAIQTPLRDESSAGFDAASMVPGASGTYEGASDVTPAPGVALSETGSLPRYVSPQQRLSVDEGAGEAVDFQAFQTEAHAPSAYGDASARPRDAHEGRGERTSVIYRGDGVKTFHFPVDASSAEAIADASDGEPTELPSGERAAGAVPAVRENALSLKGEGRGSDGNRSGGDSREQWPRGASDAPTSLPQGADASAAAAAAQPQRLQPLPGRTPVPFVSVEPVPVEPEALGDIIRSVALESNGGAQTVHVECHPRHLGRLSLRVALENGAITAHIVAEMETTQHLIETALPQLRQALSQQGLVVDSIHVHVGGSGEGNGHGFSAKDDSGRGREGHTRRVQNAARPAGLRETPAAVGSGYGLAAAIDLLA